MMPAVNDNDKLITREAKYQATQQFLGKVIRNLFSFRRELGEFQTILCWIKYLAP